jgi:hypothetical protein
MSVSTATIACSEYSVKGIPFGVSSQVKAVLEQTCDALSQTGFQFAQRLDLRDSFEKSENDALREGGRNDDDSRRVTNLVPDGMGLAPWVRLGSQQA